MGNGIITISYALCISILLNIVYFSKKRINSYEAKCFNFILVSNLIGLVLEFICNLTGLISDTPRFISILFTKLYFVYLVYWLCTFSIYIYIVSLTSYKEHRNKIIFLNTLFQVIASIVVGCLNVNLINNNNILYADGPSVKFVAIFSGLIICSWVIIIFLNIKNIKFKKLIPLLSFIALGSVAMWIQMKWPNILIITCVETFVCLIMYHTIENPDMKMIEQLNMAKDQADKANRAKTEFLSSMSHEIRTPLNAIVGFSECVLQAENLEEAKENASDIVGASKSLLEIVNSILDISKIEAGKIEIHNSNYKPNALFSEIERLIRARLGDKELEFRVDIAPDIPEVLYGDHSNIKKVIINLLTNALKYTDQGYFTFEVKCVNKDGICRLMVNVEDSGRGIKKQDLDKLFTKFQRLDEDRNTTIEGTGLGLAITKQLVELMGGKILVSSVYGEGSKFSLILDQKISNEKIIEDNIVIIEDLDLSGKKVLVVDDNKLNIKVASKILSRYKLDIDSAESGMECLDYINSGKKYDLILMDDMMPRMNGGETLIRLKKIEGFNTPVVALTANAINGMKEKYLNQGFDDYLSKPIEKAMLHQVLVKYLTSKLEEVKKDDNISIKDYSGLNILIVDDNKLNIKVARRILETYNFNIDEVLSGQECLDVVKTKKYDLIFMDYMMPEMDGIETLNHLKEIEGFNTPVIALTADAVEGAREKFLSAGFNEYVSKPIIKEILNESIEKVLNNK